MAFADVVRERLLSVITQLPGNMHEQEIVDLADRMARKHFRAHKEEFGEEDTMSRPEKHVDIGAFGDSFSLPQARIARGKMVFTKYARLPFNAQWIFADGEQCRNTSPVRQADEENVSPNRVPDATHV